MEPDCAATYVTRRKDAAHSNARSKSMPKALIRIATATAVMIAALGPAVAQGQTGPDRWGYGPHMWGAGYGMIFGPLFMILTLAAVIAVAVLLVRWLGAMPTAAPSAEKSPIDILRERFARGEIDQKELEARRKVLGV
jgi:putative membrane protein